MLASAILPPWLLGRQRAWHPNSWQLSPVLMVHPEVRRRGVARRLLAAATDHAHAHRLTPVLDVLKESEPALSLYEELGWKRAGALTLPITAHEPLQLWVYLGPSFANQ